MGSYRSCPTEPKAPYVFTRRKAPNDAFIAWWRPPSCSRLATTGHESQATAPNSTKLASARGAPRAQCVLRGVVSGATRIHFGQQASSRHARAGTTVRWLRKP